MLIGISICFVDLNIYLYKYNQINIHITQLMFSFVSFYTYISKIYLKFEIKLISFTNF